MAPNAIAPEPLLQLIPVGLWGDLVRPAKEEKT